MDRFWKPLTYNYDANQLKYISTIEAHKYPFVGVQFHPEKNIFEWATNTVGNIPHNRFGSNHQIHFSCFQLQKELKKCKSVCHSVNNAKLLKAI